MGIKCFMVEQVKSDASPYGQYRRLDDGTIYEFSQLPIGAMYYVKWLPRTYGSPEFLALPEEVKNKGVLVVKTPGGFWYIDSKATNSSSGWRRTGEPPNVTARPSINIVGAYHGFLTNGELEAC